jgi:hypothetical protein
VGPYCPPGNCTGGGGERSWRPAGWQAAAEDKKRRLMVTKGRDGPSWIGEVKGEEDKSLKDGWDAGVRCSGDGPSLLMTNSQSDW